MMKRYYYLALGVLGAGLVLAGCQSATPTQRGTLGGGAVGAGLGAIIGNQTGHAGEGALIGAGLGAVTGAIVGDQIDEERNRAYRGQPAAPAPPPRQGDNVVHGHYETRVVHGPNGERYEERVWVPHY